MYLEIFQEVVDIMHDDYAGCIDKKGWDNPSVHVEKIKQLENENKLSNNLFVDIVQDYLLDFKEPHMSFTIISNDEQKQFSNGFRVRRFQDKLYVTSVGKEKRLKIGDTITALDQIPILDLVEKHQREMREIKAEREDWRSIIKKYEKAEVVGVDGHSRLLDLQLYEKEAYEPKHSVSKVNADTLCMTLMDFFNPDTINRLIEEHKEELSKTKNLIIDVRVNNGGSDAAFQGLAPYLFPSNPTKVDFSNYAMKFNCTERNADLQVAVFEEELGKIEDKEVRKMLEEFIQLWKDNKGKGFVSFDTGDNVMEVVGNDLPERVVVLSDVYCGSAGDIFVHVCKASPKVTVIGRPTLGLNDYANLTTINWNNQFQFMYPTSRLDQMDHRDALSEPGIKPDIYIPWTPENLERDVEMEKALDILR